MLFQSTTEEMNFLTPMLPLFIYELILKSFQSYLSNKELKEATPNLQPEQTTIEWVFCLTHFEDIVLIAPEMLNDTPIDDNHQEKPTKQIKKEYFNHTHYHCWTHGH